MRFWRAGSVAGRFHSGVSFHEHGQDQLTPAPCCAAKSFTALRRKLTRWPDVVL
jgi:hypothetical protein